MAAALSEPRDAIEEIIEPFLIQQGFLQRNPRGRLLTPHAFRHLGLPEPVREGAQFEQLADANVLRIEDQDAKSRSLLARNHGHEAFKLMHDPHLAL
jgi:hypothetical protein